MSPQELLAAGEIAEAISAQSAVLRARPTDRDARWFLFVLLCYAGEHDRAILQLDTLTQQDGPNRWQVAVAYKVEAPGAQPQTGELLVYPATVDLSAFALPVGELPGGSAIQRRTPFITPNASGVRDYFPGDAFNRISWTATARAGKLMVKEFEQDPQAEVWLFLDTHRGVHFSKQSDDSAPPVDDLFLLRRRQIKLPASSLEYAVSITASLAQYFIGQRRAVGLVTASHNNYTVISAERSERQEAKILEQLAFLQAESSYTLPGLVTAQMGQLPQGSSAILVTPMIWTELLMAVDSLQRRKLRPVVVLEEVMHLGLVPIGGRLGRTRHGAKEDAAVEP
jgi:uncharacterized protein (DUF58 family)